MLPQEAPRPRVNRAPPLKAARSLQARAASARRGADRALVQEEQENACPRSIRSRSLDRAP